ncbi:hypothetical protein PR048_002931 [Dryococelus australis]|uniref:Uncharacterized protein n=1 Tax=Dryococelus australis TaxID=614101 RepID=A0ABQ9ILP0_9NEOP|nr:hypothetical protein PR048_002931 [Dryococelus australis]
MSPERETLECDKCGRQFTRSNNIQARSSKFNGPSAPSAKHRCVDTQTSPSVLGHLISAEGSSHHREVIVGAGEPYENGFMLAEMAF